MGRRSKNIQEKLNFGHFFIEKFDWLIFGGKWKNISFFINTLEIPIYFLFFGTICNISLKNKS